MNQPMAIEELVSVAQAEAMGELDAPIMAIVLSSEQSYDLPINSLETDADKARWALILRAAREHVEADAHVILHVAPDPAREVRQVRLLPPLWQMKERCGVAGPVGAEPGPVGAEPATRDCGL